MEVSAFQKELGSAICQLEDAANYLREVFRWGSHVGMYTPEEQRDNAGKLVLVQAMLPVADIALASAFKLLLGHSMAYRISTVPREREE